jgi:hypothetical protein
MRTRFKYCDQALPFPPGESPFHIKGEFYRQMGEWTAFHDERCAGGVTKVLERENLKEFASQPFLSSTLYDILPLPRIVMAVAEARSRDVRELTSAMGKGAVEGQMKGVYARFLSRLTTQMFCQRFASVIQQFYDFGPVTVTETPSGAAIVRTGVPLCIAEWWCLVTVPFIVIPLEAGGARDVTASFRIDSHGLDRGVEVGHAVGEVRWAT